MAVLLETGVRGSDVVTPQGFAFALRWKPHAGQIAACSKWIRHAKEMMTRALVSLAVVHVPDDRLEVRDDRGIKTLRRRLAR